MRMSEQAHIADRIVAWLAGALPEAEAAKVRRHLESCGTCAEERDLVRAGLSVAPLLPTADPRPGFAVRVAACAADARPRPVGAPWWRWAFGGGLAAAAIAAVAVLVARPAAPPSADEVVLAQRLDLFEDLDVVRNQDALRDLDVVAVLHTLQPEGKP
jgi:anti-sigma factor RsiW